MVLMPVYVDTAEGFLKPLVILPAAIMPFPSFIVIFSQRHHPFVLADSFISHDPLCSVIPYQYFPRPLSPLFVIVSLHFTLFQELFPFMAEQ